MPACINCHRFVLIGRGNDVHVSRDKWSHRDCPPTPGRSSLTFSSAQISRLARSPRVMTRLSMGRVSAALDDLDEMADEFD